VEKLLYTREYFTGVSINTIPLEDRLTVYLLIRVFLQGVFVPFVSYTLGHHI
jgi:hypothetical protein